jgi:polar amino acid transport system substrate-binding protein
MGLTGHYSLIVLCLLLFSRALYGCSLTLAVSSEYHPHYFKDSNNKWSGVSVDLARTLVEEAGCRLNTIDVPWSRALKLLESGEIDLLTNFTFTEQRANIAQFLGPHYVEKAAFLAKKNISEKVTTISDLAHFDGLIGLTRGAFFGPKFEKFVLQDQQVLAKLVRLNTNKERYSMLTLGRLDAVIDDELAASYFLTSVKNADDNYGIRFTLDNSPVYFALSRNSVPQLVRTKLNQAWKHMLKNKVLEKIYLKYGLKHNAADLNQHQKMTFSDAVLVN